MPDTLLVILNGLIHLLHVEVTIADVFKQRACFVIDLVQVSLGLAVGEDLIDVVAGEVGRVAVFVEFVYDPYFLINLADVFGAGVNWDLDVDIVLDYKCTVVGQLDHLFVEAVHDLFHDDYRHYRG